MLRRLLKRPSGRIPPPPAASADPLHQIRSAVRERRWTHALAAIGDLPARSRASAEAEHLRAISLHELGEYASALESVRRAIALEPAQAEFQQTAARLYYERGQTTEAKRHCQLALAADPDRLPVHTMLASIALPGADYFDLLARIHAHLRPRTYVEIGVQLGASFRLAGASTLAIGVDPEPRYAPPPGRNQQIFRQTSDAFFAEHDLSALLGGLPVDLAFIDGMHHFEFALRDFMNLERHCSREATILVHDCFPLDGRTAARERSTAFWSGDIWRFVLALRKHRPDLSIHTVGAPPTGLAIIRNLNPASGVIAANLDAICAEFLAVGFATVADAKAEQLNLFPNDWERIRELLQRHRP